MILIPIIKYLPFLTLPILLKSDLTKNKPKNCFYFLIKAFVPVGFVVGVSGRFDLATTLTACNIL